MARKDQQFEDQLEDPFANPDEEMDPQALEQMVLDNAMPEEPQEPMQDMMGPDSDMMSPDDEQAEGGVGDGGNDSTSEALSPAPSSNSPPSPDDDNFLDPDEPFSPEELDALQKSALSALYGDDFPYLLDEPSNDDWGKWPESLWVRFQDGKRKRLNLVHRNRLFRAGVQWLASTNSGPWQEPPKSPNSSRYVMNMVGPALDQRVQLVAEQRPGFKTRPTTQDPSDVKRAEAQQLALEYQYDEQAMPQIIRETSFWNGTDAVAFLHVYWDAEAGPWHELGEGNVAPAGDLRTEVLKIEQVCVSAGSTANRKPQVLVIKRKMAMTEAVSKYGNKAVQAGQLSSGELEEGGFSFEGVAKHGLELPGDNELMAGQDTVDQYTVYCEPSEYLPDGLMCVALGCYAVYTGPLLFGIVPVVRVSDGTSDPAYFPRANMDSWIEDQILVNAVISKWIDSVRRNAGGSLLARPGSVGMETMVGGMLAVTEVKGPGPIGDSIREMPAFSVGSDAKELLALAKKNFEDKSGYNDQSRGSYAGAASGRAILASREALERVFSEPVNAMATALVQWAKICLHGMRWGYDVARTIGVTGQSRSDLATEINSEDFDGIADVFIDPETLMPMPRPLRLFLLDQMFERGVITPEEYRRRLPYAYTRNLDTPDEDHMARAKRVADAMRRNRPVPPMLWQDREDIHQNVLERELLLPDNVPEQAKALANQRWIELANQAQMKMGGMPPAPGGPPQAPTGPPGVTEPTLDPNQQPMLGMTPGIATAPVAQSSGFSDEQNAIALQDRTTPY